MEQLRAKKGFICDMDGVIYRGGNLLPGVREFVDWLNREAKKFLFLTNNSGQTPLELKLKLQNMGMDIDESHFYTSAMATAKFVSEHRAVIGRQPAGQHSCTGHIVRSSFLVLFRAACDFCQLYAANRPL